MCCTAQNTLCCLVRIFLFCLWIEPVFLWECSWISLSEYPATWVTTVLCYVMLYYVILFFSLLGVWPFFLCIFSDSSQVVVPGGDGSETLDTRLCGGLLVNSLNSVKAYMLLSALSFESSLYLSWWTMFLSTELIWYVVIPGSKSKPKK